MGYKILKKKAIDGFVSQYLSSLRVETTLQSRPRYHLEIRLTNGFKCLGRVPKNIFTWYKLVPTQTQSGFINIQWHKFNP